MGVGATYLRRIERDANRHRFYRIEIVRGLFGDWDLVREWGRIGQAGRVRIDWHATEAAAEDARFALHMAKAKRGYQ
ncbi:WGR domain protein [Roseivivax jejudonensis]|uniref:WGR domain protein n=1 Tax=Roseivivax jejudonensis TaxID=1529041 RepID=A0A1X6Y888_9RHOB|nr:WGR domain-containing protein [Roseivivax jejudonensis]SLN13355.1 WGR domain protein [Roseivivax jejudonensis]